jgi:flagella basal body P-ring formation protein FlgA
MRLLLLVASLLLSPALPALAADTGGTPAGKTIAVVVPLRTIPVGSILRAKDVALQPTPDLPPADMAQSLAAVIGQQAQRNLYANRPIRMGEIGPITLVDRNSRVTLRFRHGPIQLTTVGRAMEAGGLGQSIRVMNLDSRRTIYGRIAKPGVVDVGS